jgi:hypothetical protein
LFVTSSLSGPILGKLIKFINFIGSRTGELPACIIVP